METLNRYAKITEKNPREIVLLRGTGCRWLKCTFCDYHLDSLRDEDANFALNRTVLSNVTGEFRKLEVINSGSFPELDTKTMDFLEAICREKHIQEIHFECHWMYRRLVPALRARFQAVGTKVYIKIGVETFDKHYREDILHKGIDEEDPETIAQDFDEVCLLFGLPGQTVDSMHKDVETGLRFFQRVCVNMMTENTTPIHPDAGVIRTFVQEVAPKYRDDPRVDILMNNTDFGVGEVTDNE